MQLPVIPKFPSFRYLPALHAIWPISDNLSFYKINAAPFISIANDSRDTVKTNMPFKDVFNKINLILCSLKERYNESI